MGGYGSGRHGGGSRGTVEDYKSIDIRFFRRKNLLNPGNNFSWRWFRGDEPAGSMSIRTTIGAVRLIYRWKNWQTDAWEDVEQEIPLEWTACHFGGRRPWFTCSVWRNGRYCGRRVAKLYGAGKLFACRTCYRLAHQSQHERPDGRALLKCQRIRTKLGGSPSLMEPFPDKPKGMHRRTYERLRDRAEDAEWRSWVGLGLRLGIKLP